MPRIQHKRGTSANLASVNPTPLAGELVWDSTENAIKIGDGATAWSSLAYVTATPRTHTHSADAITSGTVAYARLPVGSTTSTVCAGDDARLTDARTPTAHKASHATGGSDALTPADIGAAPAASPTFTGVITVSAGTAAAPAIVASGDANTGAFFPAADTFAISTAGVERLRVDSSGNVGIGTSPSPFNALFNNLVVGNGSSTEGMTIYSSTQGTLAFGDTATTAVDGYRGSLSYIHSGDYMAIGTGGAERFRASAGGIKVTGVITADATSGSAGSYAPSLTFSGDANTGFGQVSGQSDTASVFTAGLERVRVKSGGAVRFVPLSADPASGEAGDVYYNSSTSKLRVYNGTSWVDLH